MAEDGVVMASDGQATSAEGSVPTRTSTEKLDLLHGRIAYGCAGPAGLRQRVRRSLEATIDEAGCDQALNDLRDPLHQAVNKAQDYAAESHIKTNMYADLESIGVLFAGHSGGQPWIYEVTRTGGDQEHFIGEAIGDGRHFAAYALVSAEHYDLQNRRLRQVRMLAYRAIDDAIRTDASALGPPIHLVEVTSNGAQRIEEQNLEAVKGAVIAWQGHEREIFDLQPKVDTGPPPDTGEHVGIEPPDTSQSGSSSEVEPDS
jgi:20S proteasome alpha/beta subunit